MIQKKSLKDAIQNPEIISVVGGLLPEATDSKKGVYPQGYINTVKRISVPTEKEYSLGTFNTPTGVAVYMAFKFIAGNGGDCLVATVSMGRSGATVPRFGLVSTNKQEVSRFLELKYKTDGEAVTFYLKVKLNGTISDEIPYTDTGFMHNINLQKATIPDDAVSVEL